MLVHVGEMGGGKMSHKLFLYVCLHILCWRLTPSFFDVVGFFSFPLLGITLSHSFKRRVFVDERLGVDKCDVLCGIAIGMTTVIFHMKYDV